MQCSSTQWVKKIESFPTDTVHIFWESYKNMSKSPNFFDATKYSNKIRRFHQILVALSEYMNSIDINLMLSEIKASEKRVLKDWQIGSNNHKMLQILIFLVGRINFRNIKNEFRKGWNNKWSNKKVKNSPFYIVCTFFATKYYSSSFEQKRYRVSCKCILLSMINVIARAITKFHKINRSHLCKDFPFLPFQILCMFLYE